MASGFGNNKFSSTYLTAGYGRIYVGANVSQSINSTARTVTITVRALLTYYRAGGGSWNPGTTVLFNNSTAGNYVRATVDGSYSSTGATIGLNGANTTLTVGNYYNLFLGGVTAYGEAEVTKSTTFNYNSNGDPITKTWSASVNYAGSVLTVSGTVTTDGISSAGTAPSNGYINDLSSYYYDNEPWVTSSDIGVDAGGVTLNILKFYLSEDPFTTSVPSLSEDFSNGSQAYISKSNAKQELGGFNIQYNKQYYTGIYATNSKGNYTYAGPTVVTIPAPAAFSVLHTTADSAVISYATTADAGFYSAKLQYSVDNGTTWVDATDLYTSSTAKDGTFIIPNLPSNTSSTIRVRNTTAAGSTEATSLTVVTKKAVLYGPVNGQSEKIIKLYGSVGGESKAIKKLYGSVNGRAKLIYKEN